MLLDGDVGRGVLPRRARARGPGALKATIPYDQLVTHEFLPR